MYVCMYVHFCVIGMYIAFLFFRYHVQICWLHVGPSGPSRTREGIEGLVAKHMGPCKGPYLLEKGI